MRDQVSIAAAAPAPELLRRAARLQMLTIVWMSVEAIVASTAAWTARSPALLGFSGDSAIELFSAIIVLWRFRAKSDLAVAEQLAARVAGVLLFVVAAFVIVSSGLSLLGYREAQPSIIGIIVLIVAAIGMPWLASQKRKVATKVASAALRADATESSVCGYLSLIALAGLLANAIFRAPWADPIAALALVPFIAREAWQAVHTSPQCCN